VRVGSARNARPASRFRGNVFAVPQHLGPETASSIPSSVVHKHGMIWKAHLKRYFKVWNLEFVVRRECTDLAHFANLTGSDDGNTDVGRLLWSDLSNKRGCVLIFSYYLNIAGFSFMKLILT
jgi:hypothetical protein